MKELLAKLIQYKTTADNTSELYAAVDYLDMYFNDYDVHTSRYEKNKKPSLVITSKFTKSPKVMLNGHIDVVPADADKFTLKFDKNKAYARGTADMKGQVAAMISAVEELIQDRTDLDIGLMITTDEEIGGLNGVNYLINEEKYTADVAFVPDQGKNWQVCTDEKGAWHIKVIGIGSSAHGSRPWLGDNAINKCWKTYMDIRDEFRARWGKLRDYDRWKPTINLGALHGGDAANKVPNNAEMLLDIRFPGQVEFEVIQEIVKNAAQKRESTIESLIVVNPTKVETDTIAIKKWCDVVKNNHKKEIEFIKSDGGSDARYFSSNNIPVVMTSPSMSDPHIDDEWIDFDDLYKFKDSIKKWIISMHS